MSYSYNHRRIQIGTTILRIGNTQHVFKNVDNDTVLVTADHIAQSVLGTPTILRDSGLCLITIDEKTVCLKVDGDRLSIDRLIRAVFTPENTKGAPYCQWISKLNTTVEIQHVTTIYPSGRGWGWNAQLFVRQGHSLVPVGKPSESGAYRERTVIETCEALTWIFPVEVDPDLSPDLAEMVRED